MVVYVLNRKEELLSILSSEGDSSIILNAADLSQSIDSIDTLQLEIAINDVVEDSLKEENYLLFQDIKGVWNFFVIKEVIETHSETEHYLTVTGEQSGQELIDYECSYEMKDLDRYPSEHLEYILAGTRWKMGEVDTVTAKKIVETNTKGKNVLYALNVLLDTYGMEVQYRIEVVGNTIVNRFVDVKKQIGIDSGKRVEFEKNLDTIVRTVSTAELKTAMIGQGGIPEKVEEPTPTPPDTGSGGGTTPTPPPTPPAKVDEYLNLNPTVSAWRVYKTNVSPNAGNECGYLNPKKFGGLSYLIKSKPQDRVYSIQTADFGYVNIKVNPDGDSSFTNSPVYHNNRPYALKSVEEELPIDLIDFEWTSSDGLASTKKGQNFIEVVSATEQWGYKMADGTLQARVGWFVNNEITDHTILAEETYAYLKQFLYPRVSYKITAKDLYALTGDSDYLEEHIQVGDRIVVVDKEFSTPIALQVRVVDKNSDLLNPENTEYTLGDEFVDLITGQGNGGGKVQGSDIENIGSNSDLQQINGDIIKTAKLYADEINADKINVEQLDAAVANVKLLIADKVNVSQLEAINGTIQNLATNVATIDKAVINKADISQLEAVKGDIENLRANDLKVDTALIGKADITELNVLNGKFDTLAANTLTVDTLKANLGKFDQLLAGDITVDGYVSATVGRFNSIEVDTAKISTLETLVANINSLLAGNISAGNIQTGGITGDNLNMETIFVKDANIVDLSASKITTGEIDTSKIVISSADGGMRLVGSTQQFIDENGRIRIQLGKDNAGDFDFYILAENGDILFNTRGITGNAISNGLIKETMLSDGAVGGKKINWNSFATEFNSSTNTSKLVSSKILLDGSNQTLDIHFAKLSETVSGNTTQIAANTTQISTQQGKINTLIQDTTVVKDGQSLKLKDEYSKLEQTVGGINTTVGKQQTTINGINTSLGDKANKNDVYTKGETMTSTAITSAISQKAEEINLSVTGSINGVYDQINDVQQNVINSYESALQVAKDSITTSVSEMYAKKDEVTSMEEMLTSKIDQTAKDISLTFNKSTNEVKDDLQGFKDQVTSYIRFSADGMELGKQGSKFKTKLNNEKLAFLQDEEEVAYISNNKMYITDTEIKNQLTLGSYAFVPRANKNLSLKWVK